MILRVANTWSEKNGYGLYQNGKKLITLRGSLDSLGTQLLLNFIMITSLFLCGWVNWHVNSTRYISILFTALDRFVLSIEEVNTNWGIEDGEHNFGIDR